MEFLNSILVEVSGHKLESSNDSGFVWFSILNFPFYNIIFLNRLEYFVKFSGFCLVFYPKFSILQNNIHKKTRIFFKDYKYFKQEKSMVCFLKIRQKRGQ